MHLTRCCSKWQCGLTWSLVARICQVVVPFKRKRSKNEPKQPDTAYICYWRSRRQELLREDPDMDPAVVSKTVGRQWKALSDDERQVRR